MKAKAAKFRYVIIALLIASLFIVIAPAPVTAAIEVINAQSYPTVGGNWTVVFNTTGQANLTITAVNGTAWSNENEDNDLKFLEVKCGDDILDYEWVDNSVFIPNYNCDETGYEISKVLTPGKHTLEFRFGGDVEYAHNQADGYAEYSSDFTAPYCSSGKSPCIANSSLLMSRDSLGTPEPNQPNTIDTCTDGTFGTYQIDESVENITITDYNNSYFTAGDTVGVEARVYCYDPPGNDRLGLIYTNDSNAASPSWRVIQYISSCPSAGFNKMLFNNFTLDDIEGNHSVRVYISYDTSPDSSQTCAVRSSGNRYDDNDDVVFLVAAANQPPITPTSLKCDGSDNCNVSVDTSVTLNCSGSTDLDGDDITYFIEALLETESCSNNGSCDSCGIEEDCTGCSDAGCSWNAGGDELTNIHYQGWEAGAGGWNDPSDDDSNRQTEGTGNNPPLSKCDDSGNCNNAGGYMWHIRDDSSFSHTEQNFDFTGYDYVNLTFWSWEHSFDNGNEYVVVRCDGNEVWRLTDGDYSEHQWLLFSVQIKPTDCIFDSSVEIKFDGAPGLSGDWDNWYIDGVNITGVVEGGAVGCSGELDCSAYNNQSSCEICSQCSWSKIKKWTEIGSHTEATTLNWNTTDIAEQTCIDLRARAIDLTGSNTYSDYYTKGCCLNISHGETTPPEIKIDEPTESSPVYKRGGELFYVNFTYTEEHPKNYTVEIRNSSAVINSSFNDSVVGGSNKFANESFYLNPTAADGKYNVTVKMYDTSSNSYTAYQNYSVVKDEVPPTWQNQGSNTTTPLVGVSVLLYAQGKDEIGLDYAILSTNESGAWGNITDGRYGSPLDMGDATDWAWSNFTWQNASVTVGTMVGWRIWYNDIAGNWNVTDIMSFTIQPAETTPPTYSNDEDDSGGSVSEGTVVNVSVLWNDNVELDWGVLRTNKTGTWQNETWYGFTATPTPQWFNTTIDTSGHGGKTICWVQWANDTSINWNTSMSTTAHCFNVVDITPPAAITNLSAYTGMNIGEVYLTWIAPGDDGNIGTATTYDIRNSTSEITEDNWDSATKCEGEPAPQPAGSSETFTVTGLSAGITYYFAIKAADEVPNQANLSNPANATAQNVTIIPASISLSAYPDSIEVGGYSSIISAKVIGNNSQPYIGANVSFTTTLGNFSGAGNTTWAITNPAGFANVTLLSSNNIGDATINATVVFDDTSISDTTTVTFTPGPPAILLLEANPRKPFANDIDTSTITATVKDKFENPISNKSVTFSSFVDTELVDTKTVRTNTSGQASIELLATLRIQDVNVTAFIDSHPEKNNYTIVSFVAGDPYKLMINANPKVIGNTSYHVNKSTIAALVVDEWYHALNGWEVNFNITNGIGTLSSDYETTNSDGEAAVTLNASDIPGDVTVTATLVKNESLNGSIIVRVVGVPFVSIETTIEPKSVTTLPANVTVTHTLTGVGEPPFKPVDVILTTDLSGSMRSEDAWDEEEGKDIRRIDAAKKALKTFINISLATETTRVGLAAYGNSSEEYSDATWDKWLLPGAPFHPYAGVNDTSYINPKKYDETTENGHSDAHIDANLTQNEILLNGVVDSYNAYGGTCIGGGINAASEALNLSWDPSHLQFIVIMSDGIPTMAPIEPNSMNAYMPSDYNSANDYSITAKYAAINASKIAQEKNITVYSIGFGDDADQDTLRAVASDAPLGSGREKNYFFAANSTQLQEIYNEIYEEIEAIAGSADVTVVLPGVTDVDITGAVIPNATYIPPTNISFFSYADNTTNDITHEPTITNNTDMNTQNLGFTIGEPIYPGDVVVISYTLLVNGTGEIINGSSTVVAGGFNQTFGPLFAPRITGPPHPGFGNDPPVANAGENMLVHRGEELQFDGSGSSDSDGWIVNYTWNFGDGNITTTTNEIITHTYSAEGPYMVTLTVTDNDDKESDSDTVNVIVFSMEISASPTKIWVKGQGIDISTITVNATRDNGTAVDGVEIIFDTTLGTLDSLTATTNASGLATVKLTSGDVAGTATIKATEQCSYAFVTTVVEIRSRGEITLE